MAVRVDDPEGTRWVVRRGVLRGSDGHGWRWRWRGPRPGEGWLDSLSAVDVVDVGVGGVIGAIVGVVLVAVVVLLLPFVALAVLEALLIAVLIVGAAVAAPLFGRQVLVRARTASGDESHVFAVRGRRASRDVRDRVVRAIRTGGDVRSAAGRAAVRVGG